MKYFKYLKYILNHKYFVLIECCKLGILWRGITHDFSKLLPSELCAYAEYFYGKKPKSGLCEETVKKKFNLAWLYHQRKNKHHWQYWLLKEDDGKEFSVGMPNKYLKEMLADWRGAGKAITGKDNTKQWYLKNKDKIILREDDRKWIEDQLE